MSWNDPCMDCGGMKDETNLGNPTGFYKKVDVSKAIPVQPKALEGKAGEEWFLKIARTDGQVFLFNYTDKAEAEKWLSFHKKDEESEYQMFSSIQLFGCYEQEKQLPSKADAAASKYEVWVALRNILNYIDVNQSSIKESSAFKDADAILTKYATPNRESKADAAPETKLQ